MAERRQVVVLVVTVVVTTVLVALAARATERYHGPQQVAVRATPGYIYDASRNEEPARFRADVPGRRGGRILLLGDSQFRVVKRGEGTVTLGAELARVAEREVVDWSGGGQSIAESSALLYYGVDTIAPTTVVFGVSLLGTQRVELRPSIASIAEDVLPLLRATRSTSPTVVKEWLGVDEEPRSKTVQERTDKWIRDAIAKRVTAFQQRRAIYQNAIERPLRRDLVRKARTQDGVKTARTYGVGPGARVAVASLRAVVDLCKERGIELVFLELPVLRSTEPPPFADGAERTFDQQTAEFKTGPHAWVDLSRLLSADHFGAYLDGSQDAFHFDAAGHRTVAGVLAQALEDSGAVQ